jgi:hypothetical protein
MMKFQTLANGRVLVTYQSVEYQSSLWVLSTTETEVVYAERPDGVPIARVYKKDGEWYLSTQYLQHWQPVNTLTKYDGFLFLLKLRKNGGGQ